MVAVNCAGGWTTDPNNQVTPFARLSDPFPGNGGDGPLSPPGNSLGALNDVGFGGAGNLKSITHTPYEQTWTLGFEKELPGKIILETSYVGKKGTHLYFSGASELNHLPISVESLTQIAQLEQPVIIRSSNHHRLFVQSSAILPTGYEFAL